MSRSHTSSPLLRLYRCIVGLLYCFALTILQQYPYVLPISRLAERRNKKQSCNRLRRPQQVARCNTYCQGNPSSRQGASQLPLILTLTTSCRKVAHPLPLGAQHEGALRTAAVNMLLYLRGRILSGGYEVYRSC
jgi:hypothetical protein